MPATWPSTLPQYLQIPSNQFQTPDGRLKSPTDTGPGKIRPRTSALGKPFSGNMLMTGAQLATLDTFVSISGDSVGGSLPFTFPAPYGGGTWLVRFAATLPTKVNMGGDTWQVSLALEQLP